MGKWNVYFIKTDDCYVKIGIAREVGKRIKALQTGNHKKLKLSGVIKSLTKEKALLCEKKLHNFFRCHRVGGEWFYMPLFEQYHEESSSIIYGDGGFFLGAV